MREFVDGAELIARGAIDIGCSFFAGYPITPASTILHHMLRELPKTGGVGIQAEDEIASISMCIGAAMTGAKALTATSGPGLSLYSENIGLAIMGEVPLVIVVVMRLGPATGGATTAAQGDVQFARWGTSGGYPIIALCPSSTAECYTLTQHAFNLAERFRTPVFLLTDKEIVMTRASVETAILNPAPAVSRARADTTANYLPYYEPQPAGIPAFAPVGDVQHLTRFTTSTHDERGMITRKPEKVARLNRHLSEKIEAHAPDLAMAWDDRQAGAKTLLVSYGVTARAMQQAVLHVRAGEDKVSQLVIHSLWPVPERVLRSALAGHKRVVVAELNDGQYRQEIERVGYALDPRPQVVGLNRLDGELITPEQIEEMIAGETDAERASDH